MTMYELGDARLHHRWLLVVEKGHGLAHVSEYLQHFALMEALLHPSIHQAHDVPACLVRGMRDYPSRRIIAEPPLLQTYPDRTPWI